MKQGYGMGNYGAGSVILGGNIMWTLDKMLHTSCIESTGSSTTFLMLYETKLSG